MSVCHYTDIFLCPKFYKSDKMACNNEWHKIGVV